MNSIGIVGNGEDKFTSKGRMRAYIAIANAIAANPGALIRSGHSIMGGVDIWTEIIADILKRGQDLDIKAPKVERWCGDDSEYGYHARNLDIAKSDKVYVIVADQYPRDYSGHRYPACYHCESRTSPVHNPPHVKSGACWTGIKALELGNEVEWIVVRND